MNGINFFPMKKDHKEQVYLLAVPLCLKRSSKFVGVDTMASFYIILN